MLSSARAGAPGHYHHHCFCSSDLTQRGRPRWPRPSGSVLTLLALFLLAWIGSACAGPPAADANGDGPAIGVSAATVEALAPASERPPSSGGDGSDGDRERSQSPEPSVVPAVAPPTPDTTGLTIELDDEPASRGPLSEHAVFTNARPREAALVRLTFAALDADGNDMTAAAGLEPVFAYDDPGVLVRPSGEVRAWVRITGETPARIEASIVSIEWIEDNASDLAGDASALVSFDAYFDDPSDPATLTHFTATDLKPYALRGQACVELLRDEALVDCVPSSIVELRPSEPTQLPFDSTGIDTIRAWSGAPGQTLGGITFLLVGQQP